jgi:hypothetical protein
LKGLKMNKIVLTLGFIFAMTGVSVAHTHNHTHKHTTNVIKNVPPPVGVHNGIITAPVGSNVTVDVDGDDVDITIDGPDRGFLGL